MSFVIAHKIAGGNSFPLAWGRKGLLFAQPRTVINDLYLASWRLGNQILMKIGLHCCWKYFLLWVGLAPHFQNCFIMHGHWEQGSHKKAKWEAYAEFTFWIIKFCNVKEIRGCMSHPQFSCWHKVSEGGIIMTCLSSNSMCSWWEGMSNKVLLPPSVIFIVFFPIYAMN